MTPQDSSVCEQCLFDDEGWAQNIQKVLKKGSVEPIRKSKTLAQLSFVEASQRQSIIVRLSAFCDSGELGFHLSKINQILNGYPDQELEVVCDGSSWSYEWAYGEENFDENQDVYLPPNLPLISMIEVSRFIQILLSLQNPNLKLKIKLPPQSHPVTKFLFDARLFSTINSSNFEYSQQTSSVIKSHQQGCEDVLIPLTSVGAHTFGQLNREFHENFERLVSAGLVNQNIRPELRRIIMEAAENADTWGGGGWVTCFLRQETRGKRGFGHGEIDFSPARETHLFIHVFSIGKSLAETTRKTTEWEATSVVLEGFSSRSATGGLGMPGILQSITRNAYGTAQVKSNGYTMIITPDSLVREFHSYGSDYLPGVHLCAVIPLAVISNIELNNPVDVLS